MRFIKLLLAAFIFFMLPVAIHADGFDVNKKGSVTIVFQEAETDFHFYKIANIKENGKYYVKKQYEDTKLDLLSPARWEADAETLSSWIKAHNVGVQHGNGGSKIEEDFKIKVRRGKGKKDNIPVGVYLVVGDAKKIGDTIYYPTPFLLSVPYTGTDVENIDYIYDITVDPVKHTEKKIQLVYYKVVKHWNTDEDIPSSVDIDIFHGEDLVETVELNDENNWTYAWGPVELDEEEWYVWEATDIYGFRTTIESSEEENGDATEVVFTVTNNKYLKPSTTPEDDTEESPTPTPTPSKPPKRPSPSPDGSTTPPPGGYTPTPTPTTPGRVPNTSDRNNVTMSIIGLCASGMIALISGIVILRNSE